MNSEIIIFKPSPFSKFIVGKKVTIDSKDWFSDNWDGSIEIEMSKNKEKNKEND